MESGWDRTLFGRGFGRGLNPGFPAWQVGIADLTELPALNGIHHESGRAVANFKIGFADPTEGSAKRVSWLEAEVRACSDNFPFRVSRDWIGEVRSEDPGERGFPHP